MARVTCQGHKDTILCLRWGSASRQGERSRAVRGPHGPTWFQGRCDPRWGCWCLRISDGGQPVPGGVDSVGRSLEPERGPGPEGLGRVHVLGCADGQIFPSV